MAKNFVSNKDESVPMFGNAFMDFFSRVHFTVPLFIYVPVVLFFLYRSLFVFQTNILFVIPFAALGFAVWTFTEYNMHRFVFHWTPPGKYGPRINFMFHGVHHDYPSDSLRLVMVPVVSLPLAAVFYFSFNWLLGAEYVCPFFVGFVSGYLFYDMTHFALHHVNFKNKFWLELKQHHMVHHYSDHDNGFGVSSKFWDMVYRTTFKKKKSAPVMVEEEKVEQVVEQHM
ncbi:MAG: Sterol desaturase [Bacteroidota bacterium]|nr:Sterol desaturase [Bacteroidota bacterium]